MVISGRLIVHAPVQSKELLPLLLEVLLLDPAHPRQQADPEIKAAIQADAAECLLQIALLDAGRALLQSQGEVLDALRALAGGAALTPQAAGSATGALLAIEGRVAAGVEQGGVDDGQEGRGPREKQTLHCM